MISAQMESKTVVRDDIVVRQYDPMGESKALQKMISMRMADIIHAYNKLSNSELTLAMFGYLHMNTITYVEDHVEIKLYFSAKLASRKNENGDVIVSPFFSIFTGFFFVGDYRDSIHFETITVPNYTIDEDGLHIREYKKPKLNEDVVVVRCNLPLTMAVVENVSLKDPNFEVSHQSAGSNDKSGVMVMTGTTPEFPVAVQVQYSKDHDVYHSEDAIPYLLMNAKKNMDTANKMKDLELSISDKASKKKKKKMSDDEKLLKKYL